MKSKQKRNRERLKGRAYTKWTGSIREKDFMRLSTADSHITTDEIIMECAGDPRA